jgi:signal peptidase II
VGNVIDRIRFGGGGRFHPVVREVYYWPSFNVADSAISVGVGLLAIDMLFTKKHEENSKS